METKCMQRHTYFKSAWKKVNCKELQNGEQRASCGETATKSKLSRRLLGLFTLVAGDVFSASSTQESHCLIITIRHTTGGSMQGYIPTVGQHLLFLSVLKAKTTTVRSQLNPGRAQGRAWTEVYLLPGYLLFNKMLEHLISRWRKFFLWQ